MIQDFYFWIFSQRNWKQGLEELPVLKHESLWPQVEAA